MLESTDTEGNLKIRVFWDVTLRRWINDSRRFDKKYCIPLQDTTVFCTEEFNFIKVAIIPSPLTDGYLSSYLTLRLASRSTDSKIFEELTWWNNVRNPLGSRFRWTYGLKRRSTVTWLKGLRVRMPLSVCSFDCCVIYVMFRWRPPRRADDLFRKAILCMCVCVCA